MAREGDMSEPDTIDMMSADELRTEIRNVISRMIDAEQRNAALEQQRDELQAKCDGLQARCDSYHDVLYEMIDAASELVSIMKIHSNATDNNFAWAELQNLEETIAKAKEAV